MVGAIAKGSEVLQCHIVHNVQNIRVGQLAEGNLEQTIAETRQRTNDTPRASLPDVILKTSELQTNDQKNTPTPSYILPSQKPSDKDETVKPDKAGGNTKPKGPSAKKAGEFVQHKPSCQHNQYPPFPKHPNCEICRSCKTQRAQCRQRTSVQNPDELPLPVNFADQLTADHEITNDDESRRGDRVALVIRTAQPIGYKVIQRQQHRQRIPRQFSNDSLGHN